MNRISLVVTAALVTVSVAIFIPVTGCDKEDPVQTQPKPNNPPDAPGYPIPSDGASGRPVSLTFQWLCDDPDGDNLTYDFYLGTTGNPDLHTGDLTEKTCQVGGLDCGETYYWKVVARDGSEETSSPVWSFETSGCVWSLIDIGATENLQDVWGSSATDVFVVGRGGAVVPTDGIILHFDGSSWSTVMDGMDNAVWAVWGVPSGHVYVAGGFESMPGIDPVTRRYQLLHYDGLSWNTDLEGDGRTFESVWASGENDVFVGNREGAILRYDGSNWSPMNTPSNTTTMDLWGSSGNDVYALGTLDTLYHYDGGSWARVPLAGLDFGRGYSIWGSAWNDIYIAGNNTGYQKLIVHYNGSSWSVAYNGTSSPWYGIWGSASNDVYAVGYGGEMVHFDGTQWSAVTTGTTNRLYSIWGSGPKNIYAVGESGTVVHYGAP